MKNRHFSLLFRALLHLKLLLTLKVINNTRVVSAVWVCPYLLVFEIILLEKLPQRNVNDRQAPVGNTT